MPIYLKITDDNNSGKEIKLSEEVITKAIIKIDTDDNSDIKSGKITVELKIEGKIDDESLDQTKALANWSNTPSGKAGIYRKVELLSVSNSIVKRKAVLPYAFIIDYVETYIEEGGIFYMLIKQKVDKSGLVEIDGNFPYLDDDEE